jgi:hypothetical protein
VRAGEKIKFNKKMKLGGKNLGSEWGKNKVRKKKLRLRLKKRFVKGKQKKST